ncbi:hypothetical protein HDU99_000647 [Rhizoclosmatium hyalinum]|nr:hypothetical protein HDU99_000647 [Rhizoclosmatium hyalinum]
MGRNGKVGCWLFRNSVCPNGDACSKSHTYLWNDPRFVQTDPNQPLDPSNIIASTRSIHTKPLPRVPIHLIVISYASFLNFVAVKNSTILRRATLSNSYWPSSNASELGFESLNAFLRQAELDSIVTVGLTKDTKEWVVVVADNAVDAVEALCPGYDVVDNDGARLVLPKKAIGLPDVRSDINENDVAKCAEKEAREREVERLTESVIQQNEKNEMLILIPAFEILLEVFHSNNKNVATRKQIEPLLYTSDGKLKSICRIFRHFVRRAEKYGIARNLVSTDDQFTRLLIEPGAENSLHALKMKYV